jgi:hypothetical protein
VHAQRDVTLSALLFTVASGMSDVFLHTRQEFIQLPSSILLSLLALILLSFLYGLIFFLKKKVGL